MQGTAGEITPVLTEIALDLDPPSLADSVSDLDRLNRGLKKKLRYRVDRIQITGGFGRYLNIEMIITLILTF